MSEEKTNVSTADVNHAEEITPTPERSYGYDPVVDEETAKYATTQAVKVDDETSRRLFWTVNKRILVVMLGTYFCQSLDKGTLGFSSIMGIRTDAHLVGQDYSWLGTILYMGVLVGEYPTNFLLQKLPVAKYLSVNVFLWGIVVACSAIATNWKGLMVVRFLLGIFESCVQPAFIIITSMWYTRREQTVMTSIWFCMQGVQLMVGGIIAWGTSHYVGHSMKSWQLLFVVLGCLTCTWAIFIGWWMPDSPMTAKCFSEHEKQLMIERVRANETGIQNKTYKRYQIIEALSDPLIWCYVLLQGTSTIIIGGLGVFSNIIITSFGFTPLQTQLLNIAQGAVTIVVMIGGATLSQTTGQTIWIMHLWTIPPIIGTAIIYSIPPTAKTRVGLLVAFYCTQFFLAEGNMIFSLISRNVAGQSKKSLSLTLTFVFWAAGNMTGPQVFQNNDKPRYLHGFITHFILYGVFNAILAVTRLIISRRNHVKRAAAATAEAIDVILVDQKIEHAHAFEDMTDQENPDFRYAI